MSAMYNVAINKLAVMHCYTCGCLQYLHACVNVPYVHVFQMFKIVSFIFMIFKLLIHLLFTFALVIA